jgi:glycosyltransferase involved in cell wall biosynthesis
VTRATAPLRVVQVGVLVDPRSSEPERLLEAWPALRVTARAASLAECRVDVVLAAAADALHTVDGVSYHFVAERAPSVVRRRLGRAWAPLTPRVFERVVALAPELVHFHGLSFPRHVGRLARLLNGVPLMLQDHADRPLPSWRRGVQRRGLAHAAGVAFTARPQVEPWIDAGILSPALPVLEVLESTSLFTPGRADGAADSGGAGEPSGGSGMSGDARGASGIGGEARGASGIGGDPCFLWIGRLDGNKDPLTVLEAFSKAVGVLPGARLWMCFHDAPLLERVRERISGDLRLGSRVTLLGARPHAEVELLLRDADFLVLGSHHEGSGFSVLEALACGVTPLVTDIPSLRRITGDGAVGALFPPGAAAALADAMVAWAKRDRSALRRAAREHFERRLSLVALGGELRAAYEVVLGRGRA